MIKSYKFIGISREIKKDGSINSCSSWVINSDQLTEKQAYSDALAWSGKTGDFFRFPNEDGEGYSFDNSIIVHEIKIKTFENKNEITHLEQRSLFVPFGVLCSKLKLTNVHTVQIIFAQKVA